MKHQIIKEFSGYKDLLFSGISGLCRKYKEFTGSFYERLPKGNKRIFNIYNLFLSLYITVITYFLYSSVFETTTSTVRVCLSSILLAILIFHLLLFFTAWFSVYHPGRMNDQPESLNRNTLFLFAMICFSILVICYMICFPGEMPPDVKIQWDQVQQFKFDNWHPAIHTFMMWLITRIYNHYALVIFVQIAFFSYAAGLLIATLESWGIKKKYLLPVALFIILNPYTQSLMTFAVKDSTFTILLTFLSSYMINIYLTQGKWFSRTSNIIYFAVCAGLATLIRHNGMFFTVPLLFLIILFYVKKEWRVIPAVLATLLIVALIRFPLYSYLKVTYPDNTYIESAGFPMTIMGNILVQNPNALPEETKNFLNEIASDEEWHSQYVLNDFLSIKFSNFDHTNHVIQNIPPEDFLKMTMNTIKADKLNALHAIRGLSLMVWDLRGDPQIVMYPNTDCISKETNLFRKGLKIGLGGWELFVMSIPLIKWAFGRIGWHILLLLLAGMVACCKSGFKPFLFILPSLTYNFGTMLMLCGMENVRYFHFNVVITLPFILVLIFTKDKEMS